MRRFACLVALHFALACRPTPPTFHPQRAELTLGSPVGLGLRLDGVAHNPNSVPLPVKDVVATVTVAGTALPNVTVVSHATLAPKQDTPVTVDLTIPWLALVQLINVPAGDEVPYSVDGTAHLEAAGLRFDVPFSHTGTLSKGALLAAGMNRLVPPEIPLRFAPK